MSKCLSQWTFEVLGFLSDSGKSHGSLHCRWICSGTWAFPPWCHCCNVTGYLKLQKKKKRKEKSIAESPGQTKHGGYHLPYDRCTGCRIPDNCLWFLGSLGVSGIRSSGSHLPAAVCRNLRTPLALAALAGAAFLRWWVSSCCSCQGPWLRWRPPRWWVVNPESGVRYRSALFQSFQNKILWDFWFQVHFWVSVFFFF